MQQQSVVENKLVQMFEELSGSIAYKSQCDDFKFKLANCDETIKKESEALQSLRLEKVKQKGLQEFAEQMNECLRDQKDTEKALHLAEILLTDKSIQELQGSLQEYIAGL